MLEASWRPFYPGSRVARTLTFFSVITMNRRAGPASTTDQTVRSRARIAGTGSSSSRSFICGDSHASSALLVNGLIQRHDVGRVKHGGAKMFGFQGRVLIEQGFVGHAGSNLLQDELDGEACSLENDFLASMYEKSVPDPLSA